MGTTLREAQVAQGLGSPEELSAEIKGYVDVLLGRVDPPIDAGIMTLMEVADAYFARACEIDMLIHEAEREGDVLRGSKHYRFRTGELRAFLDLTKRSAELGSRRITLAQLALQERR
jgi:hypothetical protein